MILIDQCATEQACPVRFSAKYLPYRHLKGDRWNSWVWSGLVCGIYRIGRKLLLIVGIDAKHWSRPGVFVRLLRLWCRLTGQHHQLRDRQVLHQREVRGGAREGERGGIPALQRQHPGFPVCPERGPAADHELDAGAR